MQRKSLRLVSTSPDNTEILWALGFIDELVGVSQHCDFPEGIGQEKTVVSDFAQCDVDKIIALQPDVVFCSTYYQRNIVDTLVQNHVRVFVTQPSSLESVYLNILLVAQLLDRTEKGRMVVAAMQEKMPQRVDTGLTVFAEEWGNPIISAAPWIDDMIRLAGGRPAFPQFSQGSTHTNQRIVTPQQVVDTQPDIVLLPWCGCHGNVPLHKVTERAGWHSIPAVAQQHVYPVEDSFFVRPGPRLTQGYQIICQILDDAQARQHSLQPRQGLTV